MPDTNLDPILNPDCECPTPVAETPSDCPVAEAVTFTNEILPEECPSCEDIIVAPPPAVDPIVVNVKCCEADPAYSFVQAIDDVAGSGNAHFFFELHPACARPLQSCSWCVENNTCPEDIGLVYRRGFDNVWSVEAAGAAQPLLFWVHDSHLDRVLKEVGYIKVGQGDMMNEWLPRSMVAHEFILSPAAMFPAGLSKYLNESPMIGTIPTVCTEQPAVSSLP